MKVLEKLCLIDRKLKLDMIKSTNTQHTIKPKLKKNIRKYLISSNMLIFDSYAVIKLSMHSIDSIDSVAPPSRFSLVGNIYRNAQYKNVSRKQ